MVHKIHKMGAAYVVNGEAFGADTSSAGYPGQVVNCQSCHVETNKVAKNAANWRTMPTKAACGSCHDSPAATAHIGAQISGGYETCVICHGPGTVSDVKVMHASGTLSLK
jgi:OmcA/MtrC family decaheme c-type cytochrome